MYDEFKKIKLCNKGKKFTKNKEDNNEGGNEGGNDNDDDLLNFDDSIFGFESNVINLL